MESVCPVAVKLAS